MRYIRKHCMLIIITLILIAYDYVPVKSEEQGAATRDLAVALVIDTSGSMSTTDPLKLRQEAADIFIDLLSPKDYLGIITFDSEVTVVSQLSKVQGDKNKSRLKDNLTSYITEEGDTDYNTALEEASKQLDLIEDENVSKIVLFITDGEPDPDEDRVNQPGFMDTYMEKLWGIAGTMSINNQSIYAIGFSDGIRSDVLKKICLDTGGYYQILKDSEALTNGMLEIINNIKSQESVGMLEAWDRDENQDAVQPAIIHDFFISKEGYRIGEVLGVTSSLTVGGSRLKQDTDIEFQKYELQITYEDGSFEKVSLYDDGQQVHNDFYAGDGIWSNYIVFSREGVLHPSFLVEGIYHGESIKVENKLETVNVLPGGSILISFPEENQEELLLGVEGKRLSYPVIIENNSDFIETLNITSTINTGSLLEKQINLKPHEVKNTTMDIMLNGTLVQEAQDNIHEIEITFQAEHELTSLNIKNVKRQVRVVSRNDYLSMQLKALFLDTKVSALVIAALLIGFIVSGELFYYTLFNKRKVVNGILTYHLKKMDSQTESNEIYSLTGLNKDTLVISFDINNPTADYYIPGTRFHYAIIISAEYKPKKVRFLEGWNALFQKKKPLKYSLVVTKPGIIEKDGQIYTSMYLKDDEQFESGGFIFWFSMPGNVGSKQKVSGRNVLEGKCEEGTNLEFNQK
ncbi:MAG: hypothetical protein K0R21_1444 [Anaerocolumna sp.]|nr:hypothetical protein [Anaerocolumna sp.]